MAFISSDLFFLSGRHLLVWFSYILGRHIVLECCHKHSSVTYDALEKWVVSIIAMASLVACRHRDIAARCVLDAPHSPLQTLAIGLERLPWWSVVQAQDWWARRNLPARRA